MAVNLKPSSYLNLPEHFYEKLNPVLFAKPEVAYWNKDLAEYLNLKENVLTNEERALIFSGKKIPPGTTPIAQAYSGHQFGHFSPQLGDGRARLIGELQNHDGKNYDVHLKGSGPTKFSRRGDGLATLGSVLRE